MSRVLDFNDSQSSATIPIIEGTVGFAQYATEAAFIADIGSPQGGATFYNTTLDIIEYYDAGSASWVIFGQRGTITGTKGVPIAVPVGGITPIGVASETIYVAGDGGAINITANPQFSAGGNDGDELIIIGTSDVNTLQINNGTGLSLNGSMLIVNNSAIKLKWDGITWLEISRRD